MVKLFADDSDSDSVEPPPKKNKAKHEETQTIAAKRPDSNKVKLFDDSSDESKNHAFAKATKQELPNNRKLQMQKLFGDDSSDDSDDHQAINKGKRKQEAELESSHSKEQMQKDCSEEEENDDAKIILVTKEGKNFPVPRKVARLSQLVKACLIGNRENIVSLPNVSSLILPTVVELCQSHLSSKRSEKNMPNTVPSWNVIKALHYLDIPVLLEEECDKIYALFIRNKSVQEIRDTLHLEDDFSPEENMRIQEEDDWLRFLSLEGNDDEKKQPPEKRQSPSDGKKPCPHSEHSCKDVNDSILQIILQKSLSMSHYKTLLMTCARVNSQWRRLSIQCLLHNFDRLVSVEVTGGLGVTKRLSLSIQHKHTPLFTSKSKLVEEGMRLCRNLANANPNDMGEVGEYDDGTGSYRLNEGKARRCLETSGMIDGSEGYGFYVMAKTKVVPSLIDLLPKDLCKSYLLYESGKESQGIASKLLAMTLIVRYAMAEAAPAVSTKDAAVPHVFRHSMLVDRDAHPDFSYGDTESSRHCFQFHMQSHGKAQEVQVILEEELERVEVDWGPSLSEALGEPWHWH